MISISVEKSMTILVLPLILVPSVVEPMFPWDSVMKYLLESLQGPSGPRPFHTQDPTILMNASEVIRFHGYPFENHTIVTEDGYILELHRIPYGKQSSPMAFKGPILLLHGLLTDAGCYVANGEHNSAGLIFANAGYDVWMLNFRGTRYSSKHVCLTPQQQEFYNFSFHERGIYDLPSAINTILNVTSSKQLYLLGHSMGTTAIAVFLAEKPSYEETVKAAFLLAPGIYLGNAKAETGGRLLTEVFQMLFKEMDFLPYSQNYEKVFLYMRTEKTQIVKYFVKQFLQLDDDKIDKLLKKSIEKTFSGMSIKELIHFAQIGERNTFTKYDYGEIGNIAKYNQKEPPQYELGNTSIPVLIVYGENDKTVVPEDAIHSSKEFKDLIGLVKAPDATFDHLDYLFSDDAKEQVYDTILDVMMKNKTL